MKTYLIYTSAIVLAGCTTTGRTVVEQADGYDRKPEWALTSADLGTSAKGVQFVGVAEFEGEGTSKNSCLKAAELSARGDLAKKLETRVRGLSQSFSTEASESFEEALTSHFNVTVRDLQIKGKYWERAIVKIDDDHSSDKLHCYVLAVLPTASYRKLLREIEDEAKNSEVKKAMKKESKDFFAGEGE